MKWSVKIQVHTLLSISSSSLSRLSLVGIDSSLLMEYVDPKFVFVNYKNV